MEIPCFWPSGSKVFIYGYKGKIGFISVWKFHMFLDLRVSISIVVPLVWSSANGSVIQTVRRVLLLIDHPHHPNGITIGHMQIMVKKKTSQRSKFNIKDAKYWILSMSKHTCTHMWRVYSCDALLLHQKSGRQSPPGGLIEMDGRKIIKKSIL